MRGALFIALALALAGCDDVLRERALDLAKQAYGPPDGGRKAPSKPPPVGARMNGATRTEPVSPAMPLNTAAPDQARIRVDLAGARAAVREYRMVHGGQNPPSIGALDLRLSFPGDLQYDPSTGRVRSRTYPQF